MADDIPDSTEIAGKWWEAFEDSTLNNVFQEFHSNSPDLKSIASRLEAAKQVLQNKLIYKTPIYEFGLNWFKPETKSYRIWVIRGFFGGGQNGDQNSGGVTLQVLAPVILV